MNSKKEILPWETIDEKELLNSPWLKITQESCKLSQGKIITDFYTIWQPDWVLILPRTANGNWIMTKQYRHGTGKVSLEFSKAFELFQLKSEISEPKATEIHLQLATSN